MSLIGVYLLAKTLVFRNEHFQHVFKTKTTSLKIWAQGMFALCTHVCIICMHKAWINLRMEASMLKRMTAFFPVRMATFMHMYRAACSIVRMGMAECYTYIRHKVPRIMHISVKACMHAQWYDKIMVHYIHKLSETMRTSRTCIQSIRIAFNAVMGQTWHTCIRGGN